MKRVSVLFVSFLAVAVLASCRSPLAPGPGELVDAVGELVIAQTMVSASRTVSQSVAMIQGLPGTPPGKSSVR